MSKPTATDHIIAAVLKTNSYTVELKPSYISHPAWDASKRLLQLGYLVPHSRSGNAVNMKATQQFRDWLASDRTMTLVRYADEYIHRLPSLDIRFFLWVEVEDEDDPEYPVTIKEVSEAEFLEEDGDITYERHTIFNNGANQVCLTKKGLYF